MCSQDAGYGIGINRIKHDRMLNELAERMTVLRYESGQVPCHANAPPHRRARAQPRVPRPTVPRKHPQQVQGKQEKAPIEGSIVVLIINFLYWTIG